VKLASYKMIMIIIYLRQKEKIFIPFGA